MVLWVYVPSFRILFIYLGLFKLRNGTCYKLDTNLAIFIS